MLKIKDNIDLKELEKYGFKKKYYTEPSSLCRDDDKCQIYFDLKSRRFCFCNYGYDVLYDLIKADLVEKVGDE